MVEHKTLKVIIWEHLSLLPWSPWVTIITFFSVVIGAILIPWVIRKYCLEHCDKAFQKTCGCCIRLIKGPELADGVDLTKVQLTKKTFYDKVQIASTELEFSGGNEGDAVFSISLGKVRFGLEYDMETEALSVTIYEAQNLPAADEGGASDPYIRVMLLPDTKRRYETIVLDATLNPVYEQTFIFKDLPLGELQNRTMCIRALDFDQCPQHDILGETLIPMIDLDLTRQLDMWRILVPGYDLDNPGEFRQSQSDYGDILVALKYNPALSKLCVYVIECQNLKSVDEGGVSDPFVEVSMMQKRKKVKMYKTRYIKQTLNPYYNDEFVFKLDASLTPVTDIRLLVLDYNLFSGAQVIGMVEIGAHTYGPQMRHWRDTLLAPKTTIACWHMLRAKPKAGEED